MGATFIVKCKVGTHWFDGINEPYIKVQTHGAGGISSAAEAVEHVKRVVREVLPDGTVNYAEEVEAVQEGPADPAIVGISPLTQKLVMDMNKDKKG